MTSTIDMILLYLFNFPQSKDFTTLVNACVSILLMPENLSLPSVTGAFHLYQHDREVDLEKLLLLSDKTSAINAGSCML